MIKYYFRSLKDTKILMIPEFRKGCWVDLISPTESELTKFALNHDLELGHLKDAIDPYEVPRIEKEGDVLYIFVRLPGNLSEKTPTQTVLFILSPTFITTVSSIKNPIIELVQNHADLYTSQKSKCFVLFMLHVFNSYHQSFNQISKQANTTLSKIESITNQDIINLIRFEHSINEFLSSLVPLNEALKTLLSGTLIKFFRHDKELIEDVYLSSGQLINLFNNQLSFIRNTRDAYSTIMTNNLNRIIKLFTSLTVLLTLPTIISSFYGMNVPLPFSDHPLTVAFIILFTLFTLVYLIRYFIKRDWL